MRNASGVARTGNIRPAVSVLVATLTCLDRNLLRGGPAASMIVSFKAIDAVSAVATSPSAPSWDIRM